jgi:hypothetical protein
MQRLVKAGVAILRDLHRVRLRAQPFRNQVGSIVFILDQ